MTCELITRVREVESAYMSLRARCATGASVPSGEPCVVPFILELIRLAREVADGPYGVTETVAQPSIPACLSDSFLTGLKAWIDGMTCGGVGGYRYSATIWFFSWEGELPDPWGVSSTTLDGIAIEPDVIGSIGLWYVAEDPTIAAWWTNEPHVARVEFSTPGMSAALDPANSRFLLELTRYVYTPCPAGENPFTWNYWPADETWNRATWRVTHIEETDTPPEDFVVWGTYSHGDQWAQWDFSWPEGFIK